MRRAVRLCGSALLGLLAGAAARAEEWQELSGPGVIVEAAPRYAGFAESLVRSFPARAAEVRAALGAGPPALVKVTVARDAAELSRRLSVPLRPWVAGVALKGKAHVGLNAASLRPPTGLPAAVILRHELSHLVLGERLGPERTIPLWLEEGVCQWVGGSAYLGQRSDLVSRLSFGALIPWGALVRSFPDDAQQAALAYVQSYAFVDYLATARGGRFVLELVDAAACGTPVPRAVFELTGEAQVDLESAWMRYERERERRLLYFLQAVSPLVVGAVLVVLAWRRRARVARFLLERMEEEEAMPAALPPVGCGPVREP
ncbi:MAG: hypothetical protein JXQ29_06240 [Planctomycetes bacterium]|nr:hypothetical protein [Planctomycetota bacterium]